MKEVLKGSLEGIKVIDFSTLLPGPLASLQVVQVRELKNLLLLCPLRILLILLS